MSTIRKKIRPVYLGAPDSAPQTGAQTRRRIVRTLTVNGLSRAYRLVLPERHDRHTPVPVILAFHGGGGSAARIAAISGIDERASVQGFAVSYPDGYRNSWNTGDGWGEAYEKGIDETEFVKSVIADMESTMSIDHSRIFAVGFSNGGKLVYRLACEMPEQFAAIAVVASSLDRWDARPTRPIPVLHIHGTHDQMSPLSGGYGIGQARTRSQLGVPATVAKWLEWNGLDPCPTTIKKQGKATFLVYKSTRNSADFVLCIVEELGHQWPSGETLPGLGPGTEALSARDLIVDFLAAHPLATDVRRLSIRP